MLLLCPSWVLIPITYAPPETTNSVGYQSYGTTVLHVNQRKCKNIKKKRSTAGVISVCIRLPYIPIYFVSKIAVYVKPMLAVAFRSSMYSYLWFRITTVVTNAKPNICSRLVDDVAEKSPWRNREARVPFSRRYGRREPSRDISRV